MRTIALLNMKGGVGKTTTVINLAHVLTHDYHQRVLVVDCDPQCNLSNFYTDLGDETVTVADYLKSTQEPFWEDCLLEVGNGLWLLPASPSLWELDLASHKNGDSNIMALRELMEFIEEDKGMDVVLFDCPPGFTAASTAALMAAQEVIIPVLMDGFSLEGMAEMLHQITSMHQANPSLEVGGVLINQWHRSAPVVQAEQVLRAMPVPVYRQTIRRTDKVLESTMVKVPVTEYSIASSAARDYRLLAQEIFGEVPTDE